MVWARIGFLLLAVLSGGVARGAPPAADHVKQCGELSLAHSGSGVRYRGTVRNSDYGFNLMVPDALTGWGAAEAAPFHGFTIFLDDNRQPQACIVFEIQLRVSLGEDSEADATQRTRQRIAIGNIEGYRQERTGVVNGVGFRNVIAEFSYGRGSDVYDGRVWLVTPTSRAARNYSIFRAFVAHMTFTSKGGPAVP